MIRSPGDLFVESSALAAWVLWEARGSEVARRLRAATSPWVSAIAEPECARALLRAVADGRVGARSVNAALRRLSAVISGCRIVPVDAEILERVGQSFPVEPVRTLDAIHLASLERARAVCPRIALLSFDDRVRANAENMGVKTVP